MARRAERDVKNISPIVRSVFLLCAFHFLSQPVHADPIAPQWPQPAGPGTAVWITYSYSNLLDGSLLLLTPGEVRAATHEAFGLWARYAPLHFVEVADSGPPPSDDPYFGADHPQIRIGHHAMADLAHGYYPAGAEDGLGGDIHFDAGLPWTIGTGHWNFLEAIMHEVGHTLGLMHIEDRMAIMNAAYPRRRFGRLGSAYLLAPDIEALQALYGTGPGSVHPLAPVPEPGAALLVATGIAALERIRRRRKSRRRNSA